MNKQAEQSGLHHDVETTPEAIKPSHVHSHREELVLLVSLVIFELSLAVMAMAIYVKGERPFAAFLARPSGAVFLCAAVALFVAGWVIVHRYVAGQRLPARHFRMIVTMNLVTVLFILAMGEIVVRAGSRSHLDGESFMNVVLKPKNWERAKERYPHFLEKSRAGRTFFDYDERLGWTLGKNRYREASDGEGPYWSSVEGLRAAREGFVYGKVERKTDIAILGDSFTFGSEVGYEETWGAALNRLLGEEFRILNFGVPGYGLGQAYLRYEVDARGWNPKIVILGFISEDLHRTTWVYPFLSTGWDMAFSKPRFVLENGRLTILNRHVLPPQAIFSPRSISELPFLDHDSGYRWSHWQTRWYHASYLARLFISLYHPRSRDTHDEQLLPLNAEILKSFVRSVEQAGSIPLVMYFPSRSDFHQPDSYVPLGKRVLQEAGLPYVDPTACLLEVPSSLRFASAGHYTSQGNAAIANCLAVAVREALGKPSDGMLMAVEKLR